MSWSVRCRMAPTANNGRVPNNNICNKSTDSNLCNKSSDLDNSWSLDMSQLEHKRLPLSILKKPESESSSVCSAESMVTCQKSCKLRMLNKEVLSHSCVEKLREELAAAYSRCDDLEVQLKLQSESYLEKEKVLRQQIKRLRTELGLGTGFLTQPSGTMVQVELRRCNGTFGFTVLGPSEDDNEEAGIYISSLSQGAPAQRSGKIKVWDKILKINGEDVSTYDSVVKGIKSSPDTLNMCLFRPEDTESDLFSTIPPPLIRPSPVYSTPGLPSSLPHLNAPPKVPTTLSVTTLPVTTLPTPTLPTPTLPAPVMLLHKHLISDEDFDSLSSLAVEESVSSASTNITDSVSSDAKHDVIDVLGDAREYEEVTLEKDDGRLGITLTYGTDLLQGALFVDNIVPGSSADRLGKPRLHDQILKINGQEVGVDVLCAEAITLLMGDEACVTLELARPKIHEVTVERRAGQSLGMMVAVSKVEQDKSVIISTVDPNGLVAQYGLVKGLTLHKVNDAELTGVGLKRAVETLAAATGAIKFTVFLHPSFSPYNPPRPPTPYPLVESGEGIAVSAVLEHEDTNRAVRFSVPPSPVPRNMPPSPVSRGSLDSIPSILSSETDRRRHSVESTPSRNDRNSIDSTPPRNDRNSIDSTPSHMSPARNWTRGSPSIELINNDWGSLDRSYTGDKMNASPARVDFAQSPVRPDINPLLRNNRGDMTRGPIKVSHQILGRGITRSHNPSPSYQSKPRTYENIRQSPTCYENIPIPFNVNTPHQPTAREPSKGRVMGRRERAAIHLDRKVQFGGFKPINAPNEHYV